MPRVAVPVTAITKAGVTAAAEVNGDATNGHSIANNGSTFIVVRNNGASTRTLSINLQGAVDGQPITARTVSVATTVTKYVGPFDTTRYGTSIEAQVDHADLRLSAFRIS